MIPTAKHAVSLSQKGRKDRLNEFRTDIETLIKQSCSHGYRKASTKHGLPFWKEILQELDTLGYSVSVQKDNALTIRW